MSEAVLDSSAILAVVNCEPGAEEALNYLPGARICAINLAEVATKPVVRGMSQEHVTTTLASLELRVVSYDREQALVTAELCRTPAVRSISLGDRACLGLARLLDCPAVTADRARAKLDLGVDVRLIR